MGAPELEYVARETPLPFGGDREAGTVTATLEEIRYAELLRARLRQALLADPAPAASAVGPGFGEPAPSAKRWP